MYVMVMLKTETENCSMYDYYIKWYKHEVYDIINSKSPEILSLCNS